MRKKFRLKQSNYLLRDVEGNQEVYVLISHYNKGYSFFTQNYLMLSKYLVAFENLDQVKKFFIIVESDDYDILKVRKQNKELIIVDIITDAKFEYDSCDVILKDYLEDDEWFCVALDFLINPKNIDDYFLEIIEQKALQEKMEREEIKKDMRIAQEISNNEVDEIAILQNAEDQDSPITSFNEDQIETYSILELNGFLELAKNNEDYWYLVPKIEKEIKKR
ncbi:hypothetical protein KC866_02790 [Patescibacteria group bacterium]|nr:hypothetical protein [Patescibacteria group bacterium]